MSIAAETPPGGRELCKQHSALSSYVNRLGRQHLALGKLWGPPGAQAAAFTVVT